MGCQVRRGFRTPVANLWRREFFRTFKREVRFLLPSDTAEVVNAVRQNSQVIFDRHLHRAPDPQGMLTVGLPALLIAAHRELIARGVSEDVAYEALRRAFRQTFESKIRFVTRLETYLLRDPVKAYEKHFIPFLVTVFGASFTFHQKKTDAGWVLVATKCGFYEMFDAEGTPRLTTLICEWDRNYLNVLDRSHRPIATRPTMTMATGHSHCEFHFDRAAAAPARTVDVVIESRR